MSDIDPAAVMAAHPKSRGLHDPQCGGCGAPWPCEPYRLAEALAAEQADHAEASREVHRLRPLLTAEQAKVARVEAVVGPARWFPHSGQMKWAELRAALADQPEQVQP